MAAPTDTIVQEIAQAIGNYIPNDMTHGALIVLLLALYAAIVGGGLAIGIGLYTQADNRIRAARERRQLLRERLGSYGRNHTPTY